MSAMAWDQPHFFCLHDIVLFNICGTAINMIEGNIDHLKQKLFHRFMIIPMFQKYMNMHFVVKPTASYPQFEDITPASTDATEDEDDDYDDEDDDYDDDDDDGLDPDSEHDSEPLNRKIGQ